MADGWQYYGFTTEESISTSTSWTDVPSSEAKAKLSKMLDQVGEGVEFIITRHEEMIAKLVLYFGHV